MPQQNPQLPWKRAIRLTLWYNFFSKWRCCHEKLCHESETDSRKAILDKDLTGTGDYWTVQVLKRLHPNGMQPFAFGHLF